MRTHLVARSAKQPLTVPARQGRANPLRDFERLLPLHIGTCRGNSRAKVLRAQTIAADARDSVADDSGAERGFEAPLDLPRVPI